MVNFTLAKCTLPFLRLPTLQLTKKYIVVVFIIVLGIYANNQITGAVELVRLIWFWLDHFSRRKNEIHDCSNYIHGVSCTFHYSPQALDEFV